MLIPRFRPAAAIDGTVLVAALGLSVGCGSSSPAGSVTGGTADASAAVDSSGPPGADASAAVDAGLGGTPVDAAPADGPITSPMDAAREGGGGSDAGVPFKGVANSACTDLPRLGASWYYNWTLSPGSCSASQFVPMIWGHASNPAEQTSAGITGEIDGIVKAGYSIVLGFNEPDNTSQSNIPVGDAGTGAIALWPSFDNAALRIGSPATQANTAGQAWMSSFMSQVNADTTGKLRVDFIAAHWYGWNSGSCDAKAATLEAYLKQIEAIPGNRPIWLTEFGCLNQSNPTAAVVQTFFSAAVAMFAKHPRLERYAWYPWTTNNELVDSSGALTSLGTAFAAAPPYK